jgi:hypothetical protein
MYPFIGIIFLISLITIAYLSEQAHATVIEDLAKPGIKDYYDSTDHMYFDFDSSWTMTQQEHAIFLTGNGAQFYFTVTEPSPGGPFPSADAPIDQIAKNVATQARSEDPTSQLVSQGPVTISIDKMPGYQSKFIQQQGGKKTVIDQFLISSGGLLYNIVYIVPESSYQQSLQYRNSIISDISVGQYYDRIMAPVMKQKTDIYIKYLYTQGAQKSTLAQQNLGITTDTLKHDREQLDKQHEEEQYQCRQGYHNSSCP